MNEVEKLNALKQKLKNYKKIAVAFSSGVDSTFLLKVAHDVLGQNVIAITIKSDLFPSKETDESIDFCKKENIEQIIIYVDQLEIEGFANNPQNRCYICKKFIFSKIKETAELHGFNTICEGSNIDDLGDYRPGLKAISELNIISPLVESHLEKAEIRKLSKELNLKTWDKASFACLASRFPYNEVIDKNKLHQVEKAELFLHQKGFSQYRVRFHKNIARIEIQKSDFEKMLKISEEVNTEFKQIGFDYVCLDLGAYKTGSMNIGIEKKENSNE